MKNRNVTLEELEKDKWGKPKATSHLVTECHRLRKVPLYQFSIENLRIMIGQGLSLEHLVPIALEKLIENPFVEGDFYPGDLLKAVLSIEWDFWKNNQDYFSDLQDVMSTVGTLVELTEKELLPAWQSYFK